MKKILGILLLCLSLLGLGYSQEVINHRVNYTVRPEIHNTEIVDATSIVQYAVTPATFNDSSATVNKRLTYLEKNNIFTWVDMQIDNSFTRTPLADGYKDFFQDQLGVNGALSSNQYWSTGYYYWMRGNVSNELGSAIALNLTGSDGYAYIDDDDAFDFTNGACTVACWIDIKGRSGATRASYAQLLSKDPEFPYGTAGWGLYWDFTWKVLGTRFGIEQPVAIDIDDEPDPGTCVGFTKFTNGNIVLWCGNIQATNSHQGYPQVNTAKIMFGARDTGVSPDRMNGVIDNVAMWNRALSDAEISTLVSNPVAGIDWISSPLNNSLLGVWKMDENNGSTITNILGTYPATLTGDYTWTNGFVYSGTNMTPGGGPMGLVATNSGATLMNFVPTEGRLGLWIQTNSGPLTLNSDIKGYISSDAGTNWDLVEFNDSAKYSTNLYDVIWWSAVTNFTGTGSNVLWKLQTTGTTAGRIYGIFMQVR